jgi:hypothetical protein
MPFVKLDCGMLDSTIWCDRVAREVFLTALLMAVPKEIQTPMPQIRVRSLETTGFMVAPGWYGFIPAAGTGIVRRSGADLEDGMDALERLGDPDNESRTPDFDGRRLVRVEGGFVVMNFIRYRDRDYTAKIRQKRFRDRHANSVTQGHNGVTDRNVTQAEGEAEAPEQKRASRAQTSVSRPEDVTEQVWDDFVEFRKSRRARVNETVLSRLRSQASAAGWTMDAALAESVMRGWTGFKAEWVLNRPKNHSRFNEVKHMQNMPLGSPGCLCDECIKFNAKRVAK